MTTTILSTANYKDHFIYDNLPFINSEHGELQPIEWATVINIDLIPPKDPDDEDDDYFIPPEYFLQVAASGEIRGVTRDYDENDEYFSVTADGSDVTFLKAFSTHYPNAIPTLTALMGYRKYRIAKWNEEISQLKDNIPDDD
jgi:hypothetical protein